MKRRAIKSSCLMALAFLTVMPFGFSITLVMENPKYLVESEPSNVNFSIYSEPILDGVVNLRFTNLNSSSDSFGVIASAFAGGYFNMSWAVTGLSPGDYSIYIGLANSSGERLAALNSTGTVNSSMPKIIYSSPSGTLSRDSAALSVRTSEWSTCRYGASNSSYENLSSSFSVSDGLAHNQTLYNLAQGEHVYYLRCLDALGYGMADSQVIRFVIDLAPSVDITLSDGSPVRTGTIEVRLIASEFLERAPFLEYSFDNSPNSRKQVSLSGSGDTWRGYIIITELDDNRIGTFYFSATDSAGNTGNRISNGGIFVIDAKKPPSPQSVKAVSEPDGSIRLSWYYDGEEPDYFNVYRSTAPGANFVDFYSSSNSSQRFIDRATVDKVTYYYKVSAVDKAGNEGSLSEEMYATSLDRSISHVSRAQSVSEESELPKVLPPDLVPEVDGFIHRLEKTGIDIDGAITRFTEEAKEVEKGALMEDLRIMEHLDGAKAKLQSIIKEAESLKDSYLTKEQLGQRISGMDHELEKIEQTTPRELSLVEKSDFVQSTSKEDVENSASEVFRDMNFNQNEKSDYVKRNTENKDKIKVSVQAKVISVTRLDSSKSESSLVRKSIGHQDRKELSDVIVVETIPKSIANSVNEVEFLQQHETLKEDPVVKFGFLKFKAEGEEIEYRLSRRIDLEELKNSKTVVLISPSQFVDDASRTTGYSIVSLDSFGLGRKQIILVSSGIVVILLLGGYYMMFVRGSSGSSRRMGRPYGESDDDDEETDLSGDIHAQMKEVKAELADKLLPLFVKLSRHLESNGENGADGKRVYGQSSAIALNALIDQAQNHLDNDRHMEAVNLYPRISFLYQNLPKEERAGTYERCRHLHKRIHNLKPLIPKDCL